MGKVRIAQCCVTSICASVRIYFYFVGQPGAEIHSSENLRPATERCIPCAGRTFNFDH